MPLVCAACAAADTTLPWLVLAVAPPFVRMDVLEVLVRSFELIIRAPLVVLALSFELILGALLVVLVLSFELVIGELLEVLVLSFELVVDVLLERLRGILEPVAGVIPKVLLPLTLLVAPVPVPAVPLLLPNTEFAADPL
jgi:hypothetical protein